MTIYPYSFEAEIERFGVGKARKVWYEVLMLPEDLRRELPFDQYPRLRVEGEIADVPIANAFIPTGDGRNYVIVGSEVRDGAGVGLGDRVTMRFGIADQDAVDVPDGLADALERNSDFKAHWQALTPGKKRGLCHHFNTAKTDPTRQKRLAEIVDAVTQHKGDLRATLKARRESSKSTR